MRPHTSQSIRAGFTLVELLTVIAVIGVLAGIMIPVVAHMRQKAGAVQCTANLRGLFSAMNLYATEGGQWPSVNLNNSTGPKGTGTSEWFVILVRLGYVETQRKLVNGQDSLVTTEYGCPTNTTLESTPYTFTSAPYPLRPNYALNVYWGESGVANRRVGILAVTNPQAILLLDTYNTHSSIYANTTNQLRWDSANCKIPKGLHGGGALAVMANGGVVNLSPATHPDIEDRRHWDPTL